jgi:hypothetical protein
LATGGSSEPREYAPSFEFKLFFVYFMPMVLMPLKPDLLSFAQKIQFAVVLFSALAVIAVLHKFRRGWKWPGVGAFDVWNAVASTVFGIGLMYFLWLQGVSPKESRFTHLYLGCAGIVIANLLRFLKLLALTEKEFSASCRPKEERDNGSNAL